jgi:hypothetical protein
VRFPFPLPLFCRTLSGKAGRSGEELGCLVRNISRTSELGALKLLAAFLNAVISSLGHKSRPLGRVSVMYPTRSECIRFGFASAVFERDDGSVAVLPELHAAVLHCWEACPNGWAINLACV